MIHLTIQQLSTYFDGELSESSAALVRQHFEACEACARKYAGLEAQGRALAKALAREPADPFFDRLTLEIEERIRPERPKSSAAPSVPQAEAPAVAPVVALAGDRGVSPDRPPVSRSDRENVAGRTPAPRFPWAAVALTVLIAGSAGVMLSRMARVASPRAAVKTESTATAALPTSPAAVGQTSAGVAPLQTGPGPEAGALPTLGSDEGEGGATADSESMEYEPVPTPGDEALVDLTPRARGARGGTPPARPARPAPSAGVEAEPRPEATASAPTAAEYEASAARWEEELPSLRGEEYRETRFRLADARYRAWLLAPDGDRAARAEAAIRAYLVTAPKSQERDDAALWLSRVEEAGFR